MTNHVKMTKFLANRVSLQYTDYIVTPASHCMRKQRIFFAPLMMN